MQVNLKKAAAFAAAVSATAVKIDHSYAVEIHSDPLTQDTVEAAHNKLKEQVETSILLVTTAYTLRALIAAANAPRINALLTARAMTDKQLSVLNAIPVRDKSSNLEILARKAEAARGEQRPYGGQNLTLELETESVVTPLVKALKKSKRDLDDELQALNFQTSIELPPHVVQVLTDLDLV